MCTFQAVNAKTSDEIAIVFRSFMLVFSPELKFFAPIRNLLLDGEIFRNISNMLWMLTDSILRGYTLTPAASPISS